MIRAAGYIVATVRTAGNRFADISFRTISCTNAYLRLGIEVDQNKACLSRPQTVEPNVERRPIANTQWLPIIS